MRQCVEFAYRFQNISLCPLVTLRSSLSQVNEIGCSYMPCFKMHVTDIFFIQYLNIVILSTLVALSLITSPTTSSCLNFHCIYYYSRCFSLIYTHIYAPHFMVCHAFDMHQYYMIIQIYDIISETALLCLIIRSSVSIYPFQAWFYQKGHKSYYGLPFCIFCNLNSKITLSF